MTVKTAQIRRNRAEKERFSVLQTQIYAVTHAFSWSTYCRIMDETLPKWLAAEGL